MCLLLLHPAHSNHDVAGCGRGRVLCFKNPRCRLPQIMVQKVGKEVRDEVLGLDEDWMITGVKQPRISRNTTPFGLPKACGQFGVHRGLSRFDYFDSKVDVTGLCVADEADHVTDVVAQSLGRDKAPAPVRAVDQPFGFQRLKRAAPGHATDAVLFGQAAL